MKKIILFFICNVIALEDDRTETIISHLLYFLWMDNLIYYNFIIPKKIFNSMNAIDHIDFLLNKNEIEHVQKFILKSDNQQINILTILEKSYKKINNILDITPPLTFTDRHKSLLLNYKINSNEDIMVHAIKLYYMLIYKRKIELYQNQRLFNQKLLENNLYYLTLKKP